MNKQQLIESLRRLPDDTEDLTIIVDGAQCGFFIEELRLVLKPGFVESPALIISSLRQ